MSTALGYGRKSVVRSRTDEVGVDKQRLAVERLAVERGYTLEWYEDAKGHRSGRLERTRPGYLRLLARLESDATVKAVIFYELDRAGRSVIIIDKIIKLCQSRNITLISIRDGIDTSRGIDANVTSQIQMRAVFAEYYANDVADRMRSTAAYYRDELSIPWGMWPFGFTRQDEGKDAHYLPHPTHSGTVRTCLTWYASGLSYDATSAKLNDNGIRHEGRDRLPKRFTREAIRSIVGNVLYYVGYTIIGHRTHSKDNRITLAGEGTYVERYARAANARRSPAVEPLIDEQLANAVIERRFKNQQVGRKPLDWVALLTPILYWHDIKLRADVHENWHYYHPRGAGPWLDGDALDNDIITRLSKIQFPEEMRVIIRKNVAERVGDETRLKAIADVARIERQMETLTDLLLNEQIQRPSYNERFIGLERALRDAKQQLSRETEIDVLMSTLSDLGTQITAMRVMNRKRAVAHIFDRIDVDDAGQITRLTLKPWARTAWGEIAFAMRAYANHAPGEI